MEHRCESEMMHGRRWRAVMGAAVALAAVVPSGAVSADDSWPSVPLLRGAPAVVARDTGTLAVCALAASPGCAGAGAIQLAGDLARLGLRARGGREPGGCAATGPVLGELCEGFGTSVRARPSGPPAWPVRSAPASSPQVAPGPQVAPAPRGSLASTGTPIGTALAGLVLLAAGGLLTWARTRS